MLTRPIYTALWALALPLVVARLWWKGRRQPEYREHIAERFGRYSVRPPLRCAWIHAVSVGETRAAQPLVNALLARDPDLSVVLTHMTPTGRATGEALYSAHDGRVRSVYLPYDLPWLQRRFLDHFRPLTSVVMETEVWPNLVAVCQQRGIPLALVNGRLSARSLARYRRIEGLAREAFAGFDVVAAQTPTDAERFAALGVTRLEVTGNIKFDIAPDAALQACGEAFRHAIGERKVVLAASTREGEEPMILAAAGDLIESGALLVIVPRHPQRFDAVAEHVRSVGLRVSRRSETSGPNADDQVWLGDSMGEMTAYYTLADLALMGGTWLPFGGQNLIECCATGTPVLLGPHTFNFSDASEQAVEAGGALRCADVDAAVREAGALLEDDVRRGTMGRAGKAFATKHGGATARTMALVEPLLDTGEQRWLVKTRPAE